MRIHVPPAAMRAPTTGRGAAPRAARHAAWGVATSSDAAAAPWQSRSVIQLASRVGRGGGAEEMTPMTLDGPSGTILAAMGTAQDHTIAGSAISQSIVSGAAPMSSAATLDVRALANEWRSAQRSITSGRSASATAQPSEQADYETQMALADPARQASFAAVYEYSSALDGRPLYVGTTDGTPELAYQSDHARIGGVRDLARGGGSAKVVWAGVGTGSVGPEQMKAAREAVAAHRSARQRVTELRSAKPYSYHSHRMVG